MTRYRKTLAKSPLTLCGLTLMVFALASFVLSGTTQADKTQSRQPSQRTADGDNASAALDPASQGGQTAVKGGGTVTPTASTGTTQLFTINAAEALGANGDYLSSSDGMNSFHRFFIEVPPGLSNFQVEIFDADVGAGGSGEAGAGRDRARNSTPTFDSAVNYTMIDPTGATRPVAFSSGDASTPAGADNAWLTFFSGTGNTVADNFGSNAYTNNDGNNNWATNWVESDGGGGGATGGAIRVTGGELRLQDDVSGTPDIYRQVDLLGTPGLNMNTAFLSFTYRTSNNLESGDQISVQVSGNGGGSYTTLETFSDDSSGSRTYDISGFIANNTRIRFQLVGGYTGSEFFFVDNLQISDGGAPTAGHWELRVDMSSSVTSGNDINAIGIRAHDGTSGSGGTELPIYMDSIAALGVNPPASGNSNSRSYTLYPYITSGCSCAQNDFDYDSNSGTVGSSLYTSRTGVFTRSLASGTFSANDVWNRDSISGYTSDTASYDYGIWTAEVSINTYIVSGQVNGNYSNYYISNYAAPANPPTTNPIPTGFRIYIPTDAGTTPVKPYLTQTLTRVSGPNPPAIGQASVYTVAVQMFNPTAQAITFSASNLITANVPGSGVVYGGNAVVNSGSIVSQPTVGSSGNITWNPGTVGAGETATLTYRVTVTPSSAGQRLLITATPASGNGTRARYVDETGNTTQARATFSFGPLCELAVTQGLLTAVEDLDCAATGYTDGVMLEWKTASEVNNLGFNIYREEAGRRVRVNPEILAGSALRVGPEVPMLAGESYAWWDAGAQTDHPAYYIEDLDLNGASTWHGPYYARQGEGKPPARLRAVTLRERGRQRSTEALMLQSAEAQSGVSPIEDATDATHDVQTFARKVKRPSLEQTAQQAELAIATSFDSVKLLVRREGWYKVTLGELAAAGFNASVQPQTLQLFVDGLEVPIKVTPNDKGVLDSSSTVEFYGYGLDTPATDARAYFLSGGKGQGRRIEATKGATPGIGANKGLPRPSFPHTIERRERFIYLSALQNGERENFFGAVVPAAGADQTLTLHHADLASGTPATLEIVLQGVTTQLHRVRVELNGATLGEITHSNMLQGTGKFTVPHAQLREGINTVRLTSTNGNADVSLVDYLRLSYQHTFDADGDTLTAAVSGGEQVTMRGFTSNAVKVYDVTTTDVKELPCEVSQSGNGYLVTVTAAGAGTRKLFALTAAQAKQVAAIKTNYPSTWKSNVNAANLLIVTSRDFFAALEPLRMARQSEGYSVALIDVEDLYDEFSFGHKSPQAIRDLLNYARANWRMKPGFLLLVGDASYDPKNYLGLGEQHDRVPTKFLDTAYLETASDDWFSDFNNDGVADLASGRLPVNTPQEATAVVNKLLRASGIGTGLSKQASVMLVSDANDNAYNFENASEQLKPLLPVELNITEVQRGQLDAATAKARFIEALNSGQKLVNYAGHGSVNMWRGELLTAAEAASLSNTRLPLFVSMTCLNAYFIDPAMDSLAEALLKSERGGALAVWASTGLTYPQEQTAMNQELYNQLFPADGSVVTLGEAVNRAKLRVADLDIRRTWVFLGDPTSKLR